MKHPLSAQTVQIETLIANLSRSVELLNVDIATEEERARVKAVSEPAYPIIARQLRAHRDNLNVTIAALKKRLEASETMVPWLSWRLVVRGSRSADPERALLLVTKSVSGCAGRGPSSAALGTPRLTPGSLARRSAIPAQGPLCALAIEIPRLR